MQQTTPADSGSRLGMQPRTRVWRHGLAVGPLESTSEGAAPRDLAPTQARSLRLDPRPRGAPVSWLPNRPSLFAPSTRHTRPPSHEGVRAGGLAHRAARLQRMGLSL